MAAKEIIYIQNTFIPLFHRKNGNIKEHMVRIYYNFLLKNLDNYPEKIKIRILLHAVYNIDISGFRNYQCISINSLKYFVCSTLELKKVQEHDNYCEYKPCIDFFTIFYLSKNIKNSTYNFEYDNILKSFRLEPCITTKTEILTKLNHLIHYIPDFKSMYNIEGINTVIKNIIMFYQDNVGDSEDVGGENDGGEYEDDGGENEDDDGDDNEDEDIEVIENEDDDENKSIINRSIQKIIHKKKKQIKKISKDIKVLLYLALEEDMLNSQNIDFKKIEDLFNENKKEEAKRAIINTLKNFIK